MELDELKTKWHELDGRLSCADTKIDRLTAEVSAGKITSAKQRLARTIRLGIFLLAVLPLCFANISRTGEADPGTAVKATLALFILPLLISLGFYVGSLTSPYVFYGFVAGLIVGLPLSVRIFLRMMGDINALRAALRDVEE